MPVAASKLVLAIGNMVRPNNLAKFLKKSLTSIIEVFPMDLRAAKGGI